jgi:putative permease
MPARRRLISQVWEEVHEQIGNYIRGKVLEIVIVGSVCYLVFSIMGLQYAFLLAVLVGVSVIIPYIGAVLVTIPVVVIAFLQWGLSSQFGWFLLVYGVIIAIDANVLVPLLFSEVVRLHPVAIILAVLVFGGLWGFWGVFFAIPLASFVKAVLKAWPNEQFEQ